LVWGFGFNPFPHPFYFKGKKEGNMAQQNNATHSANPQNRGASLPDYESVCQAVGHLFIESSLTKKRIESNYGSLITDLSTQVEELIAENEKLKSEPTVNETD